MEFNTLDNSCTYKLKPPEDVSQDALYFTIVGGRKPYAFFINSRNMSSFQWITGLMTAWSEIIEAGILIETIIDRTKETFQPGGSYIIPDGSGREAHSVVHHLGLVLEQHISDSAQRENQK